MSRLIDDTTTTSSYAILSALLRSADSDAARDPLWRRCVFDHCGAQGVPVERRVGDVRGADESWHKCVGAHAESSSRRGPKLYVKLQVLVEVCLVGSGLAARTD
ncbi:hypothetical protein [Nocardia sp. NPDC049526]|uniref:hypothetical protein n=1 Tax=Nocardia sp. NPDC049526 TaxID=3364316 RepID=UPI0037ABC1FB